MYGYATQKFALLVNIAKTETFISSRSKVYLIKLLITPVDYPQNCFVTLLSLPLWSLLEGFMAAI